LKRSRHTARPRRDSGISLTFPLVVTEEDFIRCGKKFIVRELGIIDPRGDAYELRKDLTFRVIRQSSKVSQNFGGFCQLVRGYRPGT